MAMSDGSGLHKLTQTGGGSPFSGKRIGAYAISPDGNKVAFGEPGAYVANLWTYDIASNSFAQLTADGSDSTIPSWSPDGSRIIYVKATGVWEIFSMAADGTDIRQHTNTGGTSTDVSYSPDGSKIVFGRGGNPAHIFVQDATGLNSNPVDLTADIGGHSFHGAFSPDSRRVAFGHQGITGSEVWVMNADGTGKVQLTVGANVYIGITWTPDGEEIFFSGVQNGQASIYAVNAQTAVLRHVTSGAAYDTYPAFSQTPDLNSAPTADAGPDQSAPLDSPTGAAIVLDGSGSLDPDNDTLSYTWSGPFPEGGGTVSGPTPTVTLPLGTSLVTLTVSDGQLSSQDTVSITVFRRIDAAGPAGVWIGLKNSDDVGTKFDLLAEVYLDGELIGSGITYDVPGGSSGFNNASRRAVALSLSSMPEVHASDTLSFKLSVRIAVASGHRSGTARLWFNDAAADSMFSATIGQSPGSYYLLTGSALGTAPGGLRSKIDVFVDRAQNGNPFKPFGTWSVTLP